MVVDLVRSSNCGGDIQQVSNPHLLFVSYIWLLIGNENEFLKKYIAVRDMGS